MPPVSKSLTVPKHLCDRLVIGIETVTFTPFPSGFQFRTGDVPVWTALLQHSTQVLPKLFEGRPAKKPVACIDLEYDKTVVEDLHMWDHRIAVGVRILGNVEMLLNMPSRIGHTDPISDTP